jgi:hypothetical protein
MALDALKDLDKSAIALSHVGLLHRSTLVQRFVFLT